MGLLDATQGDARKWAKNSGTELGVAAVTDGEGVEVGNTVDKRLEEAFAVEPAKRKLATTPSSPTDEEVARHTETHHPYRAWCKVCVQGKARRSGHKARPVQVTERALVQVDYCHMTWDDIVEKPKLTAEPAIGDVVKESVSRREEKTQLQLSPKRSYGALGAAEASNFAVESQIRTMRLVAWMVRHCGWLFTRFQMKATGRTAFCSKTGRGYKHEIVEFGDLVLFHISESSGPGAKVGKHMPRWVLSVCVGKINDGDEHVLLTLFGSKRARSIRRLPETSKWNADFLQTFRAIPWNPMETEVEKVTTVDIGKPWRLCITRAMITESGQTPGCLGCMGVQKFHDERCRKRFKRIYLHTAAVPTPAAHSPEKGDNSETPADTDAKEARAEESGTKKKREADDNAEPDEDRSTKKVAVTVNGIEMEDSLPEQKDRRLDGPPGLEISTGAAAESVSY